MTEMPILTKLLMIYWCRGLIIPTCSAWNHIILYLIEYFTAVSTLSFRLVAYFCVSVTIKSDWLSLSQNDAFYGKYQKE